MKRTELSLPATAPTVGDTGVLDRPLSSERECVGRRRWDEVRDDLDRALDAALSERTGLDTVGMDASSLVVALREAERIVAKASALRLRLVTAAARSRAAAASPDASLGGLVARATGQDFRAGKQSADLAERFNSGECAATQGELGAGRVSAEKAAIVTRALDDLPAGVTARQRDGVERDLLAAARRMSPSKLRIAGRRALAVVEPDGSVVDAHEDSLLANEEERAWHACSFAIWDNRNGTMSGRFTVPALEGAALRKLVDAISAPRRLEDRSQGGSSARTDSSRTGSARTDSEIGAASSMALVNGEAVTGGSARGDGSGGHALEAGSASGRRVEASSVSGPSLALTPEERRQRELERMRAQGQVFADLLAHLPADHLGAGAATTVLVTTSLEVLRDQVAAASSTDTGHQLSAAQVRRLACSAGIIPAVLDTDSVPLDLGRRTRLFTPAQRTALGSVYAECAADGCDRPYGWCELHHLTPWSEGGDTDLANAVPLCPHHHRLLHRDGVQHEVRRRPRGRTATGGPPGRGSSHGGVVIRFRV